MASVGIIGLGSYVPPHEMSNEDWAEIVETSDEWITTKTGMKRRRIADKDTHTSDLAVEACKRALDDAGLTPDDIDLVILAPHPLTFHFPQQRELFRKNWVVRIVGPST